MRIFKGQYAVIIKNVFQKHCTLCLIFASTFSYAQSSITLYGDTINHRYLTDFQNYSKIGVHSNLGFDVFATETDSIYDFSIFRGYAPGINLLKTDNGGNVIWSKILTNGVAYQKMPNTPSCYNFNNYASYNAPEVAISYTGDIGLCGNTSDSCSYPHYPDVNSNASGFIALFSLLDGNGVVKKSFTWRPTSKYKSGTLSGGYGHNIISTTDGGFLSVVDLADSTGYLNV